MAAEDFFNRWSRRKPEADGRQEASSAAGPGPARQQEARPAAKEPAPPPTQADVDRLRHDSDYAAFMAGDVDEVVRRSAMKKLFSDPHFNLMDGLDVYIDDYTKFEPIPAAMIGALHHAKALLDPLSQLEQPVSALLASASDRSAAEQVQPETPEGLPHRIVPSATAASSAEEAVPVSVQPTSAPEVASEAKQETQANTQEKIPSKAHAPTQSGANDSNLSRS